MPKRERKRTTGIISVTQDELRARTLPLSGYDWVEVELDDASEEAGPMVSFVTLKPKDGTKYFLPLEVTTPQASYIVLGKHDLGDEMAFQSSYHMMRTMAGVMDLQFSRVVIDAAEPRFSKGKIEVRRKGSKDPLFYLDTSGGEAVTVAQMLGIPMFALKNQLILDEDAD